MSIKDMAAKTVQKIKDRISHGVIYDNPPRENDYGEDFGMIYGQETNMLAIERFDNYDDYIASYYVFSVCGNFAGEGYIHPYKEQIEVYRKTIDYMVDKMSGKLRMDDVFSDSFLEFEFKNNLNNHLRVRGKLCNYSDFPSVTFEFEADQTILFELKKALKQ